MSAMTHIQVRGDLMWTLFSWSPHQTEILVSSVVTRIVWIGVGLLRIGTCVQWWENSTTDNSDFKYDSVDGPYGRECTLGSFGTLKS